MSSFGGLIIVPTCSGHSSPSTRKSELLPQPFGPESGVRGKRVRKRAIGCVTANMINTSRGRERFRVKLLNGCNEKNEIGNRIGSTTQGLGFQKAKVLQSLKLARK